MLTHKDISSLSYQGALLIDFVASLAQDVDINFLIAPTEGLDLCPASR